MVKLVRSPQKKLFVSLIRISADHTSARKRILGIKPLPSDFTLYSSPIVLYPSFFAHLSLPTFLYPSFFTLHSPSSSSSLFLIKISLAMTRSEQSATKSVPSLSTSGTQTNKCGSSNMTLLNSPTHSVEGISNPETAPTGMPRTPESLHNDSPAPSPESGPRGPQVSPASSVDEERSAPYEDPPPPYNSLAQGRPMPKCPHAFHEDPSFG